MFSYFMLDGQTIMLDDYLEVEPEQEKRLLHALEQTNAGPLSGEGLRELWKEILALTKREVH